MTTHASEVLKKKSLEIMKRWEERARKEVHSGGGTSSLAMRDALPGHLEQLVFALASCGKKNTDEIAKTTIQQEDVGKEHGRDRAHASSHYSIDEVILEYRILRQVIIETLEEELPLTPTEREIITDLIEQAVNDAASEFLDTVRDMREQFTDTLTHDLRGPITAAKASAELILRRLDRPDLCSKSAIQIIDSLARMDGMIQNLLDTSRIRAGEGLAVQIQECEPSAIAHELIDDLTTIYGDRFKLKADPHLQAWWSCDLFRRALENLLTNAVKYGGSTSSITATLTRVESSIAVEAHNEGNPIPKEEIPNLFQRFGRSQSAENSTNKGWGLGLTLVAGVVDAHQGIIKVESSKEHGTSFIMTLPIDCRDKNL